MLLEILIYKIKLYKRLNRINRVIRIILIYRVLIWYYIRMDLFWMMGSLENIVILKVKNYYKKFILEIYQRNCKKNISVIFRLNCRIKKILFIRNKRKNQRSRNFKVRDRKLVIVILKILKSNVKRMIYLKMVKSNILCS